MFYGSCLVTGNIYEFFYDVITQELKFLDERIEYINFYKTLIKIDWTENGTGFFFFVICSFFITVGLIRHITNTNGRMY